MNNTAATLKRHLMIALMGASVLSLGACETMRDLAGVDKSAPDEFRVVNKPPLMMPPDYNLRPPRAGEPEPQQLPASTAAVNALFPGRTTLPPPQSAGEQALVEAVGGGDVSPSIRNVVGDDTTLVVEKGVLLQDVLSMGERTGSPDGSGIERQSSQPINNGGNGGNN